MGAKAPGYCRNYIIPNIPALRKPVENIGDRMPIAPQPTQLRSGPKSKWVKARPGYMPVPP